MSKIIVCPICKSEIAVEDINKIDVDCDCGTTITRPSAIDPVTGGKWPENPTARLEALLADCKPEPEA